MLGKFKSVGGGEKGLHELGEEEINPKKNKPAPKSRAAPRRRPSVKFDAEAFLKKERANAKKQVYDDELANRQLNMYYERIQKGIFDRPVWPLPRLNTALAYDLKKKKELLAKLELATGGDLTADGLKVGFLSAIGQAETFANTYDANQTNPARKAHLKGFTKALENNYGLIEKPLNQIAIRNLGMLGFASNPYLGLAYGLFRVGVAVRGANKLASLRKATINPEAMKRLEKLREEQMKKAAAKAKKASTKP